MNADQIRRKIENLRKALPPEQIASLSREVAARFLNFCRLEKSANSELKIALYRALPQELDLRPLEAALRNAKCRLFYPRVVRPTEAGLTDAGKAPRTLEFIEVSDGNTPERTWKPGPYGIQEPHPDLKTGVPASELDLIFVPGVAFSESGERIGMGGGFYDRFLPNASSALRVALTFDLQVLEQVHQIPTDQPVHWVITEKREMRVPFVQEWLIQRGLHE